MTNWNGWKISVEVYGGHFDTLDEANHYTNFLEGFLTKRFPGAKVGTWCTAGVEGEGSEPPVKAGDEATWKARVATLRAELAQAEKDYDVADKANTVVAFGEAGNEYQTMLAIRHAALTPYRMKLDELRSALAALPEECRRTSGCQPGWVR